jgi:hypothetical protein
LLVFKVELSDAFVVGAVIGALTVVKAWLFIAGTNEEEGE